MKMFKKMHWIKMDTQPDFKHCRNDELVVLDFDNVETDEDIDLQCNSNMIVVNTWSINTPNTRYNYYSVSDLGYWLGDVEVSLNNKNNAFTYIKSRDYAFIDFKDVRYVSSDFIRSLNVWLNGLECREVFIVNVNESIMKILEVEML